VSESHKQRRRGGAVLLLLILLAVMGPGAGSAAAAVPTIGEVWSSAIFSSSVRLQAKVDPEGLATSYHFDYIPQSTYDANVAAAKDPFTGTARTPALSDANIGSGTNPVAVLQQASSLAAGTPYRYRLVAQNSSGIVTSAAFSFTTQVVGGASILADGRGWELVSSVDKNGGEVAGPGAIAGGGVSQAAAGGSAVTYGSEASFAGGAGAPPASQYIAVRVPGGWATQNITPPLYSGSYNTEKEGVPYQLFSGELTRGLLLNGRHCRGEGTGCAVPNPPLASTDAPAGYQNYYLREGATGAFTALLGNQNAGFLTLDPADFELRLAGSSPDLQHPVLSTCAALADKAIEVPAGNCAPAETNLYEYSPGAGLSLLNILPAQTSGTPGAALAAQSGAISTDGSRVYFTLGGNLYLREGSQTKQVDEAAGGGGRFETASADGSVAFFTKGEHLWRYLAAGAGSATDITPSGGVLGVLGASETAGRVYYLTTSGLFLWDTGATSKIADAADSSNYPPATGTARVSADGSRLLFISSAFALTGYDNTDLKSPARCGEPGGICDSQVYLYDGSLACVSCNPTNARPVGPSSISGAIANGSLASSTQIYKPRVLSADGRRVFFDSSDALGLADTNNAEDAYEWEAQGEGSCTRAGGCVSLISSGRAAGGSSFIDASVDGADAFFLTDESLVAADPGAADLYDARIGGGFPVAVKPTACEGDACQSLPPDPIDPTLTTLLTGPGNPAVRYPNAPKHCRKGFVKRKGKCIKKKVRVKKTKKSRGGRSGR
jgi:hypothetical protein